ncbi:MAG: hypothetical protein IJY25_02780 [Bacilli bacterium]|nr:hypothetical protein [Bacilli bacterium]
MSLISDQYHINKLKEYGINIKTKYIVDNKILERNTDNSINDDIVNGIRCKKEYYLKNTLVHTEKEFDSRIEYTFISQKLENKEHTCPNCGMTALVKDFIDGCPYCRTHYNIDYTDKDLGSKSHYDRVLRSNTYRIITGIIDLIISIILCYFFIKTTSRTFNNIDIVKIFIYGFILSIVLYYFFYLLDAYIIIGPIKRYKDRQNHKQKKFWNRTNIDKKTFFNNLNYEVRKDYYTNENIIDYDVLDYIEFKDYKKDDKLYVEVTAEVRVVSFDNNKIKSKIIKDIYTLKRHENSTLELKDGVNIIKCHNCGASIDATKSRCEYCNTEVNYLQQWILINKN